MSLQHAQISQDLVPVQLPLAALWVVAGTPEKSCSVALTTCARYRSTMEQTYGPYCRQFPVNGWNRKDTKGCGQMKEHEEIVRQLQSSR